MCILGTVSLHAEESSVPLPAKDPSILSFRDALQKIVNHYPLLRKQEALRRSASSQKWLQISQMLPFVKGISNVTSGDDPVYVFGSLLKQEAFQQNNFSIPALNNPRHRTNFEFALEGEVPIFQAFQTIQSIRSASFTVKAIQDEQDFMLQEAYLVSLEAYLRVILSDQLYLTVSEVESKMNLDLQQAEELKNKGMVLGADFHAAKLIQLNIQEMKNQFTSAKKESRMMVNVLCGKEAGGEFLPEGTISEEEIIPKTIENWLSEALEKRKDLQGLLWLIKAKETEVSKSRTSFLPRFSAFGRVEENSHDLRGGGENYLMGVKGSVSVLDPALIPRIKSSKASLDELKADETLLRDDINKAIYKKGLRFEQENLNIPISAQSADSAAEAVAQTEKLYQEGRKSIADLLEIRRAFLESTIHLLELRYNREVDYAGLFFLSGTLTPDAVSQFENRIKIKS